MNDRANEDFRYFPPLRVLRIVGLVILGVLAAAIFALAFGWFVMLLWNWLMPAVFGLGVITYWQAFGLVVLAKLIFGAVGGGKHMGSRREWKHGEWGPPRREWRQSRSERWHHWREFWEKEGREAFDRFLERRQGSGEKPQGPGGPGGTPA